MNLSLQKNIFNAMIFYN